MAFLEFYAFGSGGPKPEALQASRKLLAISFRAMVYQAVDYHPQTTVIQNLRRWADRLDGVKNNTPLGYFCVFQEIGFMIFPLINSGFVVTDKVIPDISVGQAWAKMWESENLTEKYGERVRYKHEYPPYFRQAMHGAVDAWAYPDEALPFFRWWIRENYIKTKFPTYLFRIMERGGISRENAAVTLEAFNLPNQLEG